MSIARKTETTSSMPSPVEQTLDDVALAACDMLEQSGFAHTRVPDTFRFTGEFGGEPLSIAPRAFVGEGMSFGRVVRVRGGKRAQVLNIVLVPSIDSPLPIFGCEVLVFARGVHLVVLDLFPTCDHSINQPLADQLRFVGDTLGADFELLDAPEWGKNVFSDDAIVIKPGARRGAEADEFLPSLYRLLNPYLAAAAQNPVAPVHMRSQIRERRALYLQDHAEEEPAGPFLERIAGEEWVEEFVFEFLFPRWLRAADRVAPWLAH